MQNQQELRQKAALNSPKEKKRSMREIENQIEKKESELKKLEENLLNPKKEELEKLCKDHLALKKEIESLYKKWEEWSL